MEKRLKIENETFEEERALYHVKDADVAFCRFEGAKDGESAMKEGRNLNVRSCHFALRYPLWHVEGLSMKDCEMTDTCRAALWYDDKVKIFDCRLGGIKALRECRRVVLAGCEVRSPEFGWKSADVMVRDSSIESEYAFLEGKRIAAEHLEFSGKYSFQYVEQATIKNSRLHTKDAFWHSKNVTVADSLVEGEYLGWYAENLTFIRCHIKGTQPLCYCKNLRLIDCTMEDADLAFEYSDVRAQVKGKILSVKNPIKGRIEADGFGEIILSDSVCKTRAKIVDRSRGAGGEEVRQSI